MALCGFGGYQKIAQTLARAGWKLSKRTVARILKEPPHSLPPIKDTIPATKSLRARYPNPIWMADVTDIASFFGLFRFHVAVILDVFSRFPLAASVFFSKPCGTAMSLPEETTFQWLLSSRSLGAVRCNARLDGASLSVRWP